MFHDDDPSYSIMFNAHATWDFIFESIEINQFLIIVSLNCLCRVFKFVFLNFATLTWQLSQHKLCLKLTRYISEYCFLICKVSIFESLEELRIHFLYLPFAFCTHLTLLLQPCPKSRFFHHSFEFFEGLVASNVLVDRKPFGFPAKNSLMFNLRYFVSIL